jgi:hypothetical protein
LRLTRGEDDITSMNSTRDSDNTAVGSSSISLTSVLAATGHLVLAVHSRINRARQSVTTRAVAKNLHTEVRDVDMETVRFQPNWVPAKHQERVTIVDSVATGSVRSPVSERFGSITPNASFRS